MSTWQIAVLLAIAACAIASLLGIGLAIHKLAKGILSIGTEIKKMNAKLESIEAVQNDEPRTSPVDREEPDLQAIEAAISNFEKLKRIDLTKP